MNSDSTFENGSHRGRDAARLGALMGGARGEQHEIDGSIPVPGLPADGAMTRDDYRRLRRGYERGISPSALERMGSADGYDADEYEEVVDARDRRASAPRTRRSGRIGPIAMLAILLTGLLGSLLLYAGGADYISGLFSRSPAQPEEDLTLVTPRPGADAVEETAPPVDDAAIDDMTPGESIASEGTLSAATMPVGAIEEVEEGVGNVDSLLAAESRRIAARKAAAKREAEAKARAEAASTTATKTSAKTSTTTTASTTKPTETKAVTPRTATTTTTTPSAGATSGRYAVQVRATPDRREADRIAAKLRAKGGANVQVVTADQNGAKVYRVRFGAFGSSEDARTKAAAMGYENVWVVPGSGK
jgi:cell division septation protein DedD